MPARKSALKPQTPIGNDDRGKKNKKKMWPYRNSHEGEQKNPLSEVDRGFVMG